MASVSLPSPSKSKMLVRSIGMDSWTMGLEQFDGKNPVKVAKHMGNPSMIWLFTVELTDGQATFVTRLNGLIVRREFPETHQNY